VRISQNAPDSAERSLNSEFKKLFEIAKSTFQITNVLLKPDNCRYACTNLLKATIANWNIIIERTAANLRARSSWICRSLRDDGAVQRNGKTVERGCEQGPPPKTGRRGTGGRPREGWIPKRTSNATKTQTTGKGW